VRMCCFVWLGLYLRGSRRLPTQLQRLSQLSRCPTHS
jgi:hypothetical protein